MHNYDFKSQERDAQFTNLHINLPETTACSREENSSDNCVFGEFQRKSNLSKTKCQTFLFTVYIDRKCAHFVRFTYK